MIMQEYDTLPFCLDFFYVWFAVLKLEGYKHHQHRLHLCGGHGR